MQRCYEKRPPENWQALGLDPRSKGREIVAGVGMTVSHPCKPPTRRNMCINTRSGNCFELHPALFLTFQFVRFSVDHTQPTADVAVNNSLAFRCHCCFILQLHACGYANERETYSWRSENRATAEPPSNYYSCNKLSEAAKVWGTEGTTYSLVFEIISAHHVLLHFPLQGSQHSGRVSRLPAKIRGLSNKSLVSRQVLPLTVTGFSSVSSSDSLPYNPPLSYQSSLKMH